MKKIWFLLFFLASVGVFGQTGSGGVSPVRKGFIPISGTSLLSGNIIPGTNNALSLGSSSSRFLGVYSSAYITNGSDITLSTNNGANALMTLKSSNGNILVGTTIDDATNKLQVSGTIFSNSSLIGTRFISTGTSNHPNIGTGGNKLHIAAANSNDNTTAASGTVANNYSYFFGTPTLTATNTNITNTNAFTVYIQGPPVDGTNVTSTNRYALYVAAGATFSAGNVLSGSSIQANGSGNTMGTYSSDPSALLTMSSTTKGLLPPRMTEAQKNSISSPAIGLIIYQTDGTAGLYVNKSTGWALLTTL